MIMYITITIQIEEFEYNIRIDRRQKVYMAQKILAESGNSFASALPDFYKSKQTNRIISAYNTFEEAGIYTGDILEAIAD
jgi:hypothetical protein